MLLILIPLMVFMAGAEASEFNHCSPKERANLVRVSVVAPSGDHPLASAWGREMAETPEIKFFEKYRVESTEFKTPPVFKGSFAAKSPEITHILDDFERMLPPFKFYREKINKKAWRSIAKFDYVKYHEAEFLLLKSGVKAIRNEVGRVSSHQVELIDRLEKSYIKRIEEALDRAKEGTEMNLNEFKEINTLSAGLLGELRSACNLTGVLRVTEKAVDIRYFREKIAERMKRFRLEVKNNPSAWKKYENILPTMFHHSRFGAALAESEDRALRKLDGWMLNRELDVFRTRQKNSYAIVEAKHNVEPLDMDAFDKQAIGGKSYRSQLLEYQEWLKFLGLDREVEVEFFPTGGVTYDLFKELQELKIWVHR